MKQKATERPLTVTVSAGIRKWYLTVNFNISEADGGFEYDSILVTMDHGLPLTETDYDILVSSIIRSKYSADSMEALLNNYLSDRSAEHENEWNEMQAWRQIAKEQAREIINAYMEEYENEKD